MNRNVSLLIKFSASTPKVCEDYSLNDHILDTSSSHKDLGIIISSDLDWSDHFQYISSQPYKTLILVSYAVLSVIVTLFMLKNFIFP